MSASGAARHGLLFARELLRRRSVPAANPGSRLQIPSLRLYTTQTPSPQSEPGSFKSSNSRNSSGPSRRQVISGLLWIPVAIYFMNNFYTIAQVEGGSMSPSMAPELNRKDIVLLNKYAASTENIFQGKGLFSYFFPEQSGIHQQDLHIGDVIFFISPLDPRQRCTKRILAMPGDIVSTSSPSTGVSDSSSITVKSASMIRIPPGHIWVEGDASASEYRDDSDHSTNAARINVPSNRKSRDSRTYGPIPMALVIGRVDCILVPFSRFGPVPPRPGFDLQRALSRRKARERNESIFNPIRATKAHPDDSTISNYVDWEWHSSSDTRDKAASPSARSSARKSRREEQAEIYRQSLSRMSRGGQLGLCIDEDVDE